MTGAIGGPSIEAVDVLAIGEAMAVLWPEPRRPLRHATTLGMGVAGAEANVAVHLATLGLRTTFVSRVGDDPFGALVRDHVTSAGVHALFDVDRSRPTGVYFKDPGGFEGVGEQGTRVHYYRAGSAAAAMDASIWPRCPPARLVHLSGITPALSESCAELVSAGLTERPAGDAVMSFDVNFRPGLWDPGSAAAPLRALAMAADVVFTGLDEAQTLWGTETPDQVRAALPGPRELIVKDGGVGATVFAPDGVVFVKALPVEIIEPVGAGDAFAAGYLYGRLTGRPPAERLRYGHHLAGHALRVAADVGSPVTPDDLRVVADREELHEF